ncbi:MAG: hypothetical protein H0W86_00210 [Armatimonadetes bacterium]|nr:hypothetical protein [Armatimonadota bacterium]
MLESAVVIVVVVLAHILLIHMILRKLGIGRPHGKPELSGGFAVDKENGGEE